MAKQTNNAKPATAPQPKPAPAPQPTAPATVAAPTSSKPTAVALQRPAGAAGSKNGNCAAAWGYYNANPALARSAAVKGCVAATGMPVATARTQYQHWYTAAKAAAAQAAAQQPQQ